MKTPEELLTAVEAGDVATVRELLHDDPTLARARNESGVSAILLARYRHQADILRALLQVETALDIFEAAAIGAAGRVRERLDENPHAARDRSSDGWTALHLACFYGNIESAKHLIAAGADVDAIGANAMANRPLHAAAAGRHTEICKLLLTHGADPDARQHWGYTALHAAAQSGDQLLVELLLEHGADTTAVSEGGDTAAAFAMTGGHAEIARQLSAAG